MECLEQRSAATVNSGIEITRVNGGYTLVADAINTSGPFCGTQRVVAKSLHEVLVLVKEWGSSPKDKSENET